MNYFIEGLQGSGKSTLSKTIHEKKRDCICISEGDYSPVELAWCAYLDERTYLEKLERYPDLRCQIEDQTVSEGDKRIICYTKIKTDDRDFYADLENYEIYNGRVLFDDFRDIILKRYRAWDQDQMIFECSLFQNIIEDMILFRCASDEDIISFYKLIRKALMGKKYHIVYLRSDDIEGNLETIRKERSDEKGNEHWFSMMREYFDHSPYAKKNGLEGKEDLIRHFEHRQALELRICREIFKGAYSLIPSKKYTETDLEILLKTIAE